MPSQSAPPEDCSEDLTPIPECHPREDRSEVLISIPECSPQRTAVRSWHPSQSVPPQEDCSEVLTPSQTPCRGYSGNRALGSVGTAVGWKAKAPAWSPALNLSPACTLPRCDLQGYTRAPYSASPAHCRVGGHSASLPRWLMRDPISGPWGWPLPPSPGRGRDIQASHSATAASLIFKIRVSNNCRVLLGALKTHWTVVSVIHKCLSSQSEELYRKGDFFFQKINKALLFYL